MESCRVGVSLPKWEQSHAEANWGRGFTTVPTLHVILSPWPCSHPIAPPCSPRSCPRPGEAVSPQMAAPSSDAAGRTGQNTVSSGAVEGGCGPEGGSWVPEPRALVLGSHPWAWLTCWAVDIVLNPWLFIFIRDFHSYPFKLGKTLDSGSLGFPICKMGLAGQSTIPFLKPLGSDCYRIRIF